MKLKLTRTVGGHAIGDTIDRGEQVARHLIAAGAATATEPTEPVKAKTNEAKTDTKAKRTRRSERRTNDTDETSEATATTDADKPAGQRGGGGPPRSLSTTAG